MQFSSDNYAAGVDAYFESIRLPFEQTLRGTAKNYQKLLIRLAWVSGLMAIGALPFFSNRIVTSIFHRSSLDLIGKSVAISDIGGALFSCGLLGILIFGMIGRAYARVAELRRAAKPLRPRLMAFAASYAIAASLERFERTKVEYHHTGAIELWPKLLIYLRWILDSFSLEELSFHAFPPPEFSVAPQAMAIAATLNWKDTDKPAYEIISGLNQLHRKVSPRLLAGRDTAALVKIFRHLSHFLYTSIPGHDSDEPLVAWGYSELTKSVVLLDSLPSGESVGVKDSGSRSVTAVLSVCTALFNHPQILIAFFAWWILLQGLFALLIFAGLRLLPNLKIDSTIMVALISGPILAAISIVAVSRKAA